jgi:hypothetical protein
LNVSCQYPPDSANRSKTDILIAGLMGVLAPAKTENRMEEACPMEEGWGWLGNFLEAAASNLSTKECVDSF